MTKQDMQMILSPQFMTNELDNLASRCLSQPSSGHLKQY